MLKRIINYEILEILKVSSLIITILKKYNDVNCLHLSKEIINKTRTRYNLHNLSNVFSFPIFRYSVLLI